MLLTMSILALIFMCGYLISWYLNKEKWQYILKPGTIIVLVALLVMKPLLFSSYWWLLVMGLVVSSIGDILLIIPNKFVHGLFTFFIAHVLYIGSFASIAVTSDFNWLLILTLASLGVLVCSLIMKGIDYEGGRGLQIAVGLYALAMCTTIYAAFSTGNIYLISGSILFALSDTLLAVNRFMKKFRLAQLLTITTYYGSQFLFVLSLWMS